MKALEIIGRVLLGIVSLGLSERWLWIHRQIRGAGGKYAGRLALRYVREAEGRLVCSGLFVKTRVRRDQVAAVDHSWTGKAIISTTGRRSVKIPFPFWRLFGYPALIEYVEKATA